MSSKASLVVVPPDECAALDKALTAFLADRGPDATKALLERHGVSVAYIVDLKERRAIPSEAAAGFSAILAELQASVTAAQGTASVVAFPRTARAAPADGTVSEHAVGEPDGRPEEPMTNPTVVKLATRGRSGRSGAAAAAAPAEEVRVYPHVDAAIADFNKHHAFVRTGTKLMVAIEKADRIDFMNERDFHSFVDNQRIDLDGQPTPISKLWKASPARRTYDGVTFSPRRDPDPGLLNLWRGWGVEPEADASCLLFLEHLANVICQGDDAAYRYALGWLAHLVQRPWEKPGVALVVRGIKGAGKDTLAEYVARMIGARHSPIVSDPSHVTGKFNAHFEAALFLRVEEGFWAGDRKAEGNLKTLITAPAVFIERKGIDGVSLPNCTRMFMSANADWVVPATKDERRFFVLEASEERRGDHAYFKALRTEMEGQGPAALLHYLETYDLTDFEIRAVPQTRGLLKQKLAALRNVPAWWYDVLQTGRISTSSADGDAWAHAGVVVGRDELRRSYEAWKKDRPHHGEMASEEVFGRDMRELTEIGDVRPRVEGRQVRSYRLPPLVQCRTAFEAYVGGPVSWLDGPVGSEEEAN